MGSISPVRRHGEQSVRTRKQKQAVPLLWVVRQRKLDYANVSCPEGKVKQVRSFILSDSILIFFVDWYISPLQISSLP